MFSFRPPSRRVGWASNNHGAVDSLGNVRFIQRLAVWIPVLDVDVDICPLFVVTIFLYQCIHRVFVRLVVSFGGIASYQWTPFGASANVNLNVRTSGAIRGHYRIISTVLDVGIIDANMPTSAVRVFPRATVTTWGRFVVRSIIPSHLICRAIAIGVASNTERVLCSGIVQNRHLVGIDRVYSIDSVWIVATFRGRFTMNSCGPGNNVRKGYMDVFAGRIDVLLWIIPRIGEEIEPLRICQSHFLKEHRIRRGEPSLGARVVPRPEVIQSGFIISFFLGELLSHSISTRS